MEAANKKLNNQLWQARHRLGLEQKQVAPSFGTQNLRPDFSLRARRARTEFSNSAQAGTDLRRAALQSLSRSLREI